MHKRASVNILHQIPQKCHKNIEKYTNVLKTLEQDPNPHVDYDTPTPLPRSRHLLQHAILSPNALHNADNCRIRIHITNPHSVVYYGSDVSDDLEWVKRLFGPLLLNNSLLVERDMCYEVRNGRNGVHNRMRHMVEPFHVPPLNASIPRPSGLGHPSPAD